MFTIFFWHFYAQHPTKLQKFSKFATECTQNYRKLRKFSKSTQIRHFPNQIPQNSNSILQTSFNPPKEQKISQPRAQQFSPQTA
jgi:hypothetical protein